MSNPTTNYPLPNYHFEVYWGGTRTGFSKITGLEVATSVIEYREGGYLIYNTTRQPGRTLYSNIILERGIFLNDFDFFTWWQRTYNFQEKSQQFRRDVIISLLDDAHNPVVVWKLLNAWPCKVKWGELNAFDNQVMMESLELIHEGLVLQTNTI
jgi:phage tail-like protein